MNELAELMPRLQPVAERVARRLVRTGRIAPQDQADCAQELLLWVARCWDWSPDSGYTPEGLARLIIRQKTANVLRTLGRQPRSLPLAIEPSARPDDGPAWSELLDGLSPEHRRVLDALAEHGSQRRAARALQLSVRRFRRLLKEVSEHVHD